MANCSSGRSHDRNVTSLFTKSRGSQWSYRSTIVAWIFARALLYWAHACLSLVEGVAYHASRSLFCSSHWAGKRGSARENRSRRHKPRR
jgi:hypothetical protein